MDSHIHFTDAHLEAAVIRVIVDREVTVTTTHQAPALNHLQRHFRIRGISEPEDARSLEEALLSCGLQTKSDDEKSLYIVSLDINRLPAAHALKALHDIAPYVSPGGHIFAATTSGHLLSLKFENAEIRSPLAPSPGPYTNQLLDTIAPLITAARERASTLHHNLGYFRLTPDLSHADYIGEAKCRYCYSSAVIQNTKREPRGRAVSSACQAPPTEGQHTISREYSFEP